MSTTATDSQGSVAVMKKRDFHKCLIAVAIIYVVRDISSQLLANQESSIFQVEGESQPLLEQQVNKKFNKQVIAGLDCTVLVEHHVLC